LPLVWLPTETDADPTTTIAAPGVSIGVAEVIVTDTASMPPVGYVGWAVIDDEVMTVTGAADNPYPIDRAQAGTVEADHAAGAAFNWTVVPATVIALVKEQVTAADVSGLADALATKLDTAALDTDGTLSANSDSKVATQKATKTYANLHVKKAGDAMSGNLVVPYGNTGSPGLQFQDSSAGFFRAGSGIYLKVNSSIGLGLNPLGGQMIVYPPMALLTASGFASAPKRLTAFGLLAALQTDDMVILCDFAASASGDLPNLDLQTYARGRHITYKDTSGNASSNPLTFNIEADIFGFYTPTIDGATSYVLDRDYGWVTFVGDFSVDGAGERHYHVIGEG